MQYWTIYSPTFLELKSLKSASAGQKQGVRRAVSPPGPHGNPSSASELLRAAGRPRLMAPLSTPSPVLASGLPLLVFLRTLVTAFRPPG